MDCDIRFEDFSRLARPTIDIFRSHDYQFSPQMGQGYFRRAINPRADPRQTGDDRANSENEVSTQRYEPPESIILNRFDRPKAATRRLADPAEIGADSR